MPYAQLPVIYQNKVREDIIKSFIKTIICQGLHSPYEIQTITHYQFTCIIDINREIWGDVALRPVSTFLCIVGN